MSERTLSATPAVPAPTLAPRRGAAPAPALSLHIDRVVLEGVTLGAHDRARLQAAIEAELAGLFAAHGLGAAQQMGVTLARLRAGNLHVDRAPDPDLFGRAIARTLHARIGR